MGTHTHIHIPQHTYNVNMECIQHTIHKHDTHVHMTYLMHANRAHHHHLISPSPLPTWAGGDVWDWHGTSSYLVSRSWLL